MISFYDSEGNVPLHSAVHGGDIKAVELCLKSGAKISTQQHDLSTPVHLACAQVSAGRMWVGFGWWLAGWQQVAMDSRLAARQALAALIFPSVIAG